MKNTQKLDNNGFSLVELIIVIAIMAILTAVIGSQVIPYMEKSRVSKDKSTLDTVYTSFQTVAADYAFDASHQTQTYPECSAYNATTGADAKSAFEELVGFTQTELQGKWGSKSAKSSGTTQVKYGTAGSTTTFACAGTACSTYYDSDAKVMAVGVGQLFISNK